MLLVPSDKISLMGVPVFSVALLNQLFLVFYRFSGLRITTLLCTVLNSYLRRLKSLNLLQVVLRLQKFILSV
jgi:hypothetical protein